MRNDFQLTFSLCGKCIEDSEKLDLLTVEIWLVSSLAASAAAFFDAASFFFKGMV
jgi:hypothetical protein